MSAILYLLEINFKKKEIIKLPGRALGDKNKKNNKDKKNIYILGIETSCDDTCASVVLNGHEILSNIVSSKNEIHAKTQKIPCILMQCPSGSNLTLLHFHGNAEDIGDCCKYMRKLSYGLKVLFCL